MVFVVPEAYKWGWGLVFFWFGVFSFFFPLNWDGLFSLLPQEISPGLTHYAQRRARRRGTTVAGAALCRCPRLPAHRCSREKRGARAASRRGFP